MRAHKILILHGWEGYPEQGWFPEAKLFLEKKGFEVLVPKLPGDYFPDKVKWLEIIKQYKPNENWILIGHSLGGATILRFLEEANSPVAQTIFCAAPVEPMDFSPIANFFDHKFDWARIRENAGRVNLIYEDDDQIVPLAHGYKLSEKLVAPIEVVHGSTHLIQMDIKLLWKAING